MTPEQSIVARLQGSVGGAPVLLCGSRALGAARPGSDFDVVVVLPLYRIPLALRRLRAAAAGLAAELGVPVSVNPLPASALTRRQNLFAWKLRREALVLAAPRGFRLDAPGALELTPLMAFSYVLTGIHELLGQVEPGPPAVPAAGLQRAVAKAVLQAAQVRLLRQSRYEPRLEDALQALGAADLEAAAAAAARPGGWLQARALLLDELARVPRPLAGAAVANARYAAVAALRGRLRLAPALSRARVDERLGDAAAALLRALDESGAADATGVAAARARLPASLRRRCVPTWTSVRDLLVREWPDAHPLGAL